MRRIALLLCLAAWVAAPVPAPAQTAGSRLAGTWEGVMRTPTPTALTLTLAPAADGWTATLSAPERNVEGLVADSVAVKGDSLRLRPGGGLGRGVFRGRLSDDGRLLEGFAYAGPNTMPFRLARPGTPEAVAFAAEAAAPFAVSHPHPDSARIVSEDVARFWAAYDASTPETRASALKTMYLDRGSPGLQDFVILRIGTAESLVESLEKFPRYYASIRASTLRAAEFEPQIREAFRRMEEIYPEAVYPDVYFLVGNLSTGGTASGRGLLIGTEVYSRTPGPHEEEMQPWMRAAFEPVEAIPGLVAHELVHYQQDNAPGSSLLRQSLNEGVADLVAELIAGGDINPAAHAYGDAHEAELWCEFRREMHGTDYGNWLYNGSRSTDRPGDLGYYMGYRIAKGYYDRAEDKRQAVRDVLRIRDFDAFLEASEYGERFTCPAEEAR